MKIRHSRARAEAKKLLGDTNHLLITLLVGVEGVRTGAVTKAPAFNVTWNPKDLEATAQRSRRFARAAALSWAVDALDAYLGKLSNQRTYDLTGVSPILNDQLTQRFIYKKLSAIQSALHLSVSEELALAHLAIQWRNNLIHFHAENELEVCYRNCIREKLVSDPAYPNRFGNIDGVEVLREFDGHTYPKFKPVAAFVQSINTIIETIDSFVVRKINIESYVDGLLTAHGETGNLSSMTRLWGEPTSAKRTKGIKLLLNSLGITAMNESDEYIGTLISLSPGELRDRFDF